MADCSTCPSKDGCTSQDTCMIKNSPHSNVKNIVGVMSGKGGVGKSTVSVMLAKELKRKGYKVGIMDADITGPSIPRLMNISNRKAMANEEGIIPVETSEGIHVMSLNLLVDDEDQPAIWRGPVIAGVVEQFWTDVAWGDLDYLIIDMPPGTGDVALTVMQSLPITGVVMVSLPQDLVSMIVSKAINMTNTMNISILGLVQNMSYVLCPDCNKRINIFESDSIEDFLSEKEVDLLGEFPMCQDIANISKDDRLGLEIQNELELITDKVIENIDKL